ncbi:hypothetical protein AB0469_39815 [Streptomyces sp. NPDC093801]
MTDFDPEGMAENFGDKFGVVGRQVKGDLKRFNPSSRTTTALTGQWRGQV